MSDRVPAAERRILLGPRGSIALEKTRGVASVVYPEVGDTVIPPKFTNPVQATYGSTYPITVLVEHGWVQLDRPCTLDHYEEGIERPVDR